MDFDEKSLPKPLAQLYTYWQAKCGGRLMPSRADINPVEMQAFLPHAMLIDVITDDKNDIRFRTRLIGTHVVNGFGGEFTGKYLDDIELGDQRGSLIEACLHTVRKKKPAYLAGDLVRQSPAELISYQRLGVPLSTDGKNVDMILVAALVQRRANPFLSSQLYPP